MKHLIKHSLKSLILPFQVISNNLSRNGRRGCKKVEAENRCTRVWRLGDGRLENNRINSAAHGSLKQVDTHLTSKIWRCMGGHFEDSIVNSWSQTPHTAFETPVQRQHYNTCVRWKVATGKKLDRNFYLCVFSCVNGKVARFSNVLHLIWIYWRKCRCTHKRMSVNSQPTSKWKTQVHSLTNALHDPTELPLWKSYWSQILRG